MKTVDIPSGNSCLPKIPNHFKVITWANATTSTYCQKLSLSTLSKQSCCEQLLVSVLSTEQAATVVHSLTQTTAVVNRYHWAPWADNGYERILSSCHWARSRQWLLWTAARIMVRNSYRHLRESCLNALDRKLLLILVLSCGCLFGYFYLNASLATSEWKLSSDWLKRHHLETWSDEFKKKGEQYMYTQKRYICKCIIALKFLRDLYGENSRACMCVCRTTKQIVLLL